jgi:imidazolonepropionase-like amidohydrolase
MNKLTHILIAFLVIIPITGMGQFYSPAPAQEGTIILIGGTAHIGNGKVIENSVIVMEDGKITQVGPAGDLADTSKAKQIYHIDGKHVYPGFIAANSILGITEINLVRATRDFREVGGWNPNVRSIIAFDTDNRVIPTVRSNGVLMSQVTPRGGVISGMSSVVELDAWNWEDAVFKEDDGIHMNWPVIRSQRGWWANPKPDKLNEAYHNQVEALKRFFDDAQAYTKMSKPTPANLRFESMRGLFDQSKTLFIYANKTKEMIEAVSFARSYGLHVVLVSARDSWKIADWLAEQKVPVILYRLHSLPARTHDDIDQSYKTPHILQEAGVLFCLAYEGGMEAEGVRNLPFLAGTAATYGLSKEQALQAITLNTATILGIADRVGSIEAGKAATLFVSEGDALDMLTNKVLMAWIQGRMIQIPNQQDQLYLKYRQKYQLAD